MVSIIAVWIKAFWRKSTSSNFITLNINKRSFTIGSEIEIFFLGLENFHKICKMHHFCRTKYVYINLFKFLLKIFFKVQSDQVLLLSHARF